MLWKVGPKGDEAGNSVLLMSLGVKETLDFLSGCPHNSEYTRIWKEGRQPRIVALPRGEYYTVNQPFL